MRLQPDQTKRIMEVVAEEMGLEFGEEFYVGDETIQLTLRGLELPYDNNDPYLSKYSGYKSLMLGHIILGKVECKKVPWTPDDGDLYYFPTPTEPAGFDCSVWSDKTNDKYRREKFGVYKTIKEATEKAQELGWFK